MNDSTLRTALLDLTSELRKVNVQPLLAGGYGLFLKQLHLLNLGQARTLLDRERWPPPRGTNDLDLLLPIEVVADLQSMRSIRGVLDELGYRPDQGAKYMQFTKPVGAAASVKVDFLTGPTADPRLIRQLKLSKPPRVRPRGAVQLHAYLAEEAIEHQRNTYSFDVCGSRSDGRMETATISIPQAFTLLLMKLHAYHDRRRDAQGNAGRRHALDVYRIVMMLTEQEYDLTRAECARNRTHAVFRNAARIVAHDFGSSDSPGMQWLREHPLLQRLTVTGKFVEVLAEFFSLTDALGEPA